MENYEELLEQAYKKVKPVKASERFEITKDILKDYGKQIEIFAKGNSLLARMYYAIFIDELASCYLALLNGQDPEPVPKIAYLKKRLAE